MAIAVRTQESSADDASLVAALQAGDDRAFEVVVRQFGGRLLAVARRIVQDEQDARDVLQSAYLSAFRGIASFDGACRLSTWLHRIVVNAALMKLRSRRRKPEASIEDLLPSFDAQGRHIDKPVEWTMPADYLLDRDQTRKRVRACIDQLPDAYREVLILRDIEELTTVDAAELLATTPNAVEVRLHRARQALTTLLRRQFALQETGQGRVRCHA